MIVMKHTVIVYALDPLSGQRVISAVHECGSRAEAEALGQTIAGMIAGFEYAQVALYTEYEEDLAGRSRADGVASWDEDPAADPFPLEYERL